MNIKNYYNILGISPNASQQEIRQVFRKLSKKFHPDKNNNDLFFEEMFKNINEAKETLTNPVKRREYDYYLEKNTNASILEIHQETLTRTNELLKLYFEKEREVIYKQKKLLELQYSDKPRFFTLQKFSFTLIVMVLIYFNFNPKSKSLDTIRFEQKNRLTDSAKSAKQASNDINFKNFNTEIKSIVYYK